MIKLGPHEADPVASLERHGEAFDFYEGHDGSPAIGRFAHWVLGKVYDVNNTHLGNSESQLADHKAAGGQFIIVPGHTSEHDPPAAAASIGASEGLRGAVGNLDVMAKEPVSRIMEDDYLSLVNLGIRLVLDNYVALDKYRIGDYEPHLATIEDEVQREVERARLTDLIKIADARLVAETIRRLDVGRDEGVFAEATRRREFGKVLPLKSGVYRIATGSQRTDNLLVVPMAIDFARDPKSKRRPDAVIGEGLPVKGTQEEFLTTLREAMQVCVDYTPTGRKLITNNQ